jgi:hypothetical protein
MYVVECMEWLRGGSGGDVRWHRSVSDVTQSRIVTMCTVKNLWCI